MKSLSNPLMQTIYLAIRKRGWHVDAYTIEDMKADGENDPAPESEGILFYDRPGLNQYWLGISEDPDDSTKEVVRISGIDVLDMFWASIEDYRCALADCLDDIDEHINSIASIH